MSNENTFTLVGCWLGILFIFHKPEFPAFPAVPWGPRNTSHISLTPPAPQRTPASTEIVFDTFCSIDCVSSQPLFQK